MRQLRLPLCSRPIDTLHYRAGRKNGHSRAYIQNRKLRLAGFEVGRKYRAERLGPKRWALILDAEGTHTVQHRKRSDSDVIPIVDILRVDFEAGEPFAVELFDGVLILEPFKATITLHTGETVDAVGYRAKDASGHTRYLFVEFAGGLGLLDLAARLVGGTPTLSFEVDPDAATQHHDNLGNSVVLADVREFTPAEIRDMLRQFEGPGRRVRFAIAGLPCEPWTGVRVHEGRARTGENDPRNLFPWFLEVMRELRLDAFVIENVPGLRQHHADYLRNAVLQPLQELGYHLTLDGSGLPPILRGRDYGCPSDRDRLFIIGSVYGTVPIPQPTHGPGRAHPYVTARDVLADLLETDLPDADDLPPRLRWYCGERPDPDGRFGTALFQAGADVIISGKNYNKRGPQFRLLDEPAFTLLSSDGGRTWIRYQGKLVRLRAHHAKRLVGCPDDFVDVTVDRLGDAVPLALGLAVMSSLVEHLRAADRLAAAV